MICAACMTPQKCGELGCKVLHPERHPPPKGGLQEHALNVADPDAAHENALREMRPVSGWISVEDRLPATSDRVMTWTKETSHRFDYCWWTRSGDREWGDPAYPTKPTPEYWMPLPDAPT